MKRLSLIPVMASTVLLVGCSSLGISGAGELPAADCDALSSFPSNFDFNPWGVHEDRRISMEYIEEDAKKNDAYIGLPYYKDWKARANAYVDDQIREIEASAGRVSVQLGDGTIKQAMESVASSASPGNLGTLEGLLSKCRNQ